MAINSSINGKRKVSILDQASTSVAEIVFFIESKGLPQTAKKFAGEAIEFLEKLSNGIMEYPPCPLKFGGAF